MPIEILRPVDFDPVQTLDRWDGFVSNIDEPLSAPDGSVMDTTVANRVFRATLTAPVDVRDVDTVTNVYVKARTLGWDQTLGPVRLFGGIVVSDVHRGHQSIIVDNTFTTKTFNHPDWNVDWTVTQLNQMSVEFLAGPIGIDEGGYMAIDTVEVEVHYTVPPPIEVDPDVYAAIISGQAPTARYDQFARPAIDTRSLVTDVPTTRHDDVQRPDPNVLILATPLPTILTKFLRPVPSSTLSLTGTESVLPGDALVAEGAAALAGKTPTVTVTESVFIDFDRILEQTVLLLETHDVGVDDFARIVSPAVLTLTGRLPTTVVTDNYTVSPAAGSLTYATGTPVANRGATFLVPEETLVLTGYKVSQVLPVPVGSMTFVGKQPVLFTEFTVLEIDGKIPVLGTTIPVLGTALAIGSEAPLVENATAIVPEGALVLAPTTVTLSYASVLLAGDPGLISLTTRYDVEHIATPADEVEF
jgi:hypothetical protein